MTWCWSSFAGASLQSGNIKDFVCFADHWPSLHIITQYCLINIGIYRYPRQSLSGFLWNWQLEDLKTTYWRLRLQRRIWAGHVAMLSIVSHGECPSENIGSIVVVCSHHWASSWTLGCLSSIWRTILIYIFICDICFIYSTYIYICI